MRSFQNAIVCEDNVYFPDERKNIAFAILIYDHGRLEFYDKIRKAMPEARTIDLIKFPQSRYGFEISADEAHLIQRIIQFCLDNGHSLLLNDNSKLVVEPPFVYTWESRERLLLKKYEELKPTFYWVYSVNWEWRVTSRVRLPELKECIIKKFLTPDEDEEDVRFKEEDSDHFKDILSKPIKKEQEWVTYKNENMIICQKPIKK
jgi:hypothetical protein